jgi:NAD(P)-dependent dehydrogenase (short-subunit alcohol dehydrogenase family)
LANLHDRVAIVTGASKGIGAAIAKALAQAGAKVVVNYASDRAGAEQVVAAIKAAGGHAVAVRADVAKSSDVRALFEETIRTILRLFIRACGGDLLVCWRRIAPWSTSGRRDPMLSRLLPISFGVPVECGHTKRGDDPVVLLLASRFRTTRWSVNPYIVTSASQSSTKVPIPLLLHPPQSHQHFQ